MTFEKRLTVTTHVLVVAVRNTRSAAHKHFDSQLYPHTIETIEIKTVYH